MAEGDVSERRSVPPALIGAAVLTAAVLVFIFQNTESTTVSWLFLEVDAPLWVVLLVTSVVAIAAAELAGRAIRRARRARR